jgi:hypothetical protein
MKVVCKNCGSEGTHKTYECPVQIVCVSVVSVAITLIILRRMFNSV